MEPHSWLYLLQVCLLLVFITFLFIVAATWLIYYWNITSTDEDIRYHNATSPPINQAIPLGDQLDFEKYRVNGDDLPAALPDFVRERISDEDFKLLMHKDPVTLKYTHHLDENGNVVPIDDV